MNRSSKPKVKDGSTDNNMSFTHDVRTDVNHTRAEGLLNEDLNADAEEVLSEVEDYLDDGAPQAINDDFEEGFEDDWASDFQDEFGEDYGDAFEVDFDDAFDDYFKAEFELSGDAERGRRNLSRGQERAVIQSILERGMVEALDAGNTVNFFEKVIAAIDDATGSRQRHARRSHPSDTIKRRTNPRQRKRLNQRNGHSKGRSSQPPYTRQGKVLRELRLLLNRYGRRGLGELDALEDTSELAAEAGLEDALPVLAGLTARVLVKPRVEHTGQSLSPAFRQKMIRAADKALKMLIDHQALEVLPGLASSLAQSSVRRQRSINSLPQEICRVAAKVAVNPRLQQGLLNFDPDEMAPISMADDETPLQLRVSGPLEILIRQPREL